MYVHITPDIFKKKKKRKLKINVYRTSGGTSAYCSLQKERRELLQGKAARGGFGAAGQPRLGWLLVWFAITWQLCAQKFLMICCSFNWLSGIRFYQECKKLKCWLLTYWDHICIISFGIIDCCKHENNRPNIGAVSNVWLRRSEETYKTWYPIILRQTCSSLARQCKIGG